MKKKTPHPGKATLIAGQIASAVPTPGHDLINHPSHYQGGILECDESKLRRDPELGVIYDLEVIEVIEAFDLDRYLTNAVKYLLRADKKGGYADLKKAIWYIERRMEKAVGFPGVEG